MPKRKILRGVVYVPQAVRADDPTQEWEERGTAYKWVEDPEQTAELMAKREAAREMASPQSTELKTRPRRGRERKVPEMPAKKLPPWTAQAKNVVGAATRVAAALSQGKNVVATEASLNHRLAVCDDCPFSTPEEKPVQKRRCTQCGCFLSRKAALSTEKCPVGKW